MILYLKLELKSQRVSNKYLYKLANEKRLYEYINTVNFQPRVNWVSPNYKSRESSQINRLSDKTLADCVEALIGNKNYAFSF